MSKQVQAQANKLWQTVTDPATAETYKKTLDLTGTILKETGYLLWLVICLVLVFGDWVWKTGYRAGWSTREWVNSLDRSSANHVFSVTGKSLLEVGKTSAIKAIATAKEQLGIDDTEEPLAVSPPPAPEPVKIAAPEPKPMTPASTPTTPAKTASPASPAVDPKAVE